MNDQLRAIQWTQLKDLTLLPDNPRQISKENFERLKRDISDDPTFLELRPVLVNRQDNVLIVYAGNMRTRAAIELGWVDIPCIVDDDLPVDVMRKRALRDNQEYGEWDHDILANEWDLELATLDLPELRPLELAEEGTPEEDDFTADLTAKYEVKQGDIFCLGDHRLMCGDSTVFKDVEALLDGVTVDFVMTDPPYGINVLGSEGLVGSKAVKSRPFAGDNSTEVARDSYAVLASLPATKNVPTIIWGGNYFTDFLPPSRAWVVWLKRYEDLRDRNDFADAELAWVSMDGNVRVFPHIWNGMNKGAERGITRVHPTQKPIGLLADVLTHYQAGEVVLDLFGGSGSTLIACEQTNRTCYMMEVDPYYCSVIIERWEKLTNRSAVQANLQPIARNI